MEESVFFGNEGLTSTNANYYCNIAQEAIKSSLERLNSVRFYETSVASIEGNNSKLMSTGLSSMDFIQNDLENIANMNSFCAWVREAIKTKDNLISLVDYTSLPYWAEVNNITVPELPERPGKPSMKEEKDIVDSWDRNKRNRYLRLEAFASTYGKYIHPNGAFSRARKDAHYAVNNPISKEGTGRDLILYYQTPTLDVEKVDDMFMQLQDIYRSYEKELNSMKAEIKECLNNENRSIEEKYQSELAKFKADYDNYTSEMSRLESLLNQWKISERDRLSKLKIVLPNNLLGIFEEIKKQGDPSSK